MKKYLLITLTMLVTFAFSSYAGNNIFIANTPKINPNYLANLQNQINKKINDIYLALSFKKKTGVKKDIASAITPTSFFKQKPVKKGIASAITPAMIPYNRYSTPKPVNPTISVSTTNLFKSPTKSPSVTPKIDLANINPADFPDYLFKSITKTVSAYEGDDITVFKIEAGTKVKVSTIKLSNGNIIKVLDFTGQ